MDALAVQYVDSTGHVNLMKKKLGYNNNSASNTAHGGQSSSHGVGSAHGMLGGQSVGMNSMGMNSSAGNGHHSSMDMQSHQHSNRSGPWVNNNNMMNSHSMMQQNMTSMSGMNHSQMQGHHNSSNPVEVSQYNNFPNMMPSNALDMNGLNQNNLVAAAHMNNIGNVSSGFTPGGMTMTTMNQGPNMGASPMQMVF